MIKVYIKLPENAGPSGVKIQAIKALRCSANEDPGLVAAKNVVEHGFYQAADVAEAQNVCTALIAAGAKADWWAPASTRKRSRRGPSKAERLFKYRCIAFDKLLGAATSADVGPGQLIMTADGKVPWKRIVAEQAEAFAQAMLVAESKTETCKESKAEPVKET